MEPRKGSENPPASAGEGGRGATGRGDAVSGDVAPLIRPAARATFSRRGETERRYNRRIRGSPDGRSIRCVSAQTRASRRSGEAPEDRPSGPKSQITSKLEFPDIYQVHAVYSGTPEHRERAQNKVRHCKTLLRPPDPTNETAVLGVGAQNGRNGENSSYAISKAGTYHGEPSASTIVGGTA